VTSPDPFSSPFDPLQPFFGRALLLLPFFLPSFFWTVNSPASNFLVFLGRKPSCASPYFISLLLLRGQKFLLYLEHPLLPKKHKQRYSLSPDFVLQSYRKASLFTSDICSALSEDRVSLTPAKNFTTVSFGNLLFSRLFSLFRDPETQVPTLRFLPFPPTQSQSSSLQSSSPSPLPLSTESTVHAPFRPIRPLSRPSPLRLHGSLMSLFLLLN